MIKSFVWTLIFWSLFILFNTIGDAIDFYRVFPWYDNMDLWHTLKYFWIGFAVATGWFAYQLYDWLQSVRYIAYWGVRARKTTAIAFILLFFLLFRWGLHEGLMWLWRQP